MSKTSNINAEDYGDVLAVVNDLEKVFFSEYGSYQGTYLAILKDKGRFFIYKGNYGSCGGCDWLESFYGDGPTLKDAQEYCADIKPLYIIPNSLIQHIDSDYLYKLLYENKQGYAEFEAWSKASAKEVLKAMSAKHLAPRTDGNYTKVSAAQSNDKE